MAFALRSLLLLCGISALLTGVLSDETVTVPCCPSGWIRLQDRCFIYINTPRTFSAAEAACQTAGGNLASIRDSVENALCFQLVRDANANTVTDTWIGLNDALQEGKFVRNDGSVSKFFDFRGPTQPDNFMGNEDCVEIDFTGQWNDETCTDTQDYLCSINLW
ncbi:alpha-N-acetylgalactosamine-specific lectin-like isoform X2 [Hippocampus zosterae]|uniref:alpha-N-acetylgalactosamine-specific lectin-like isoform X2 n=1 Tax=Hippocampus zosterae TaxID=109293 RepID=UPI00223D00C7|nr:alpha-N-acetylgalactosamine-specific lectin-like isoform X2 [Hippocampus zosterae]